MNNNTDNENTENKEPAENNIPAENASGLGLGAKIYKWLDNYWYHYKWPTLIIAFFVIVVAIMVGQMLTKDNPDVYLLYGGPKELTANQSKAFVDAVEAIMPEDYNGDGDKCAEYIGILIMTDSQLAALDNENDNSLYTANAIKNNRSAFMTHLYAGDSVICFIDSEQYESIKKDGGFKPLSEIFGADNVPGKTYDECAIKLSDTKFAKFFGLSYFPDDTLICARVMTNISKIRVKSQTEQNYKNQLDMFRAIIDFEYPEGYENAETTSVETETANN